MNFSKENIIELFKKYGGLLEGHFLLSSGLHSDKYFQCALVLQYPDIAEKIAIWIVEELREKLKDFDNITTVISPALGGIILGQEVARAIKTFTQKKIKSIFTERNDESKMVLRRGFTITNFDNVLIVEDVVTTGKSTKEVIDVVLENKGNIVGISSIFNRSDKNLDFNYPYFYLCKVQVNNYIPEECPLCKEKIPLIKPGSRKIV